MPPRMRERNHDPRERTPGARAGAHLRRARLVIGQLRDDAQESGEPFHVADLALDAAALDELWDGLDRIDSHFWNDVESRQQMMHRSENSPPGGRSTWWKFWSPDR